MNEPERTEWRRYDDYPYNRCKDHGTQTCKVFAFPNILRVVEYSIM